MIYYSKMSEKTIFVVTVFHIALIVSFLEVFIVPILWLLVGSTVIIVVFIFKNISFQRFNVDIKRLQSGRFQKDCSLSLERLTKMVIRRNLNGNLIIKRNKATSSISLKTTSTNKFLRDQHMDSEIEKLYDRIKRMNGYRKLNSYRPVSDPFPMNSCSVSTSSNRNSLSVNSNRNCIFFPNLLSYILFNFNFVFFNFQATLTWDKGELGESQPTYGLQCRRSSSLSEVSKVTFHSSKNKVKFTIPTYHAYMNSNNPIQSKILTNLKFEKNLQ